MNIRKIERNFMRVLTGQGISSMANGILRFAMSLFILDQTGSAAIFANILALSLIPTIILSPIGGIIADRFNRKKIMVVLDLITAIIVILLSIFLPIGNKIIVLGITMILLSVLNSFETPTVQASIPILVENSSNTLEQANAAISQINALANLFGPILGGMLYGFWGITPIIYICIFSFILAAIIECFIYMPDMDEMVSNDFFKTMKNDFCSSLVFLKKNKLILKTLIIISLFNMSISSMLVIGLPYIVKITLGMSSQLYGLTEGAMGAGTILGGVILGLFSKKPRKIRTEYFLLLTCISIIPIGVSILNLSYPFISYLVITGCVVVCMTLSTIFSLLILVFIQRNTPNNLLGKISSFVVVISMCSQPIGQAFYGYLFDVSGSNLYIIIFITILLGVVLGVLSKNVFRDEKYKN